MANVVIDIATEFTGKKAFKEAETSTDRLTKNVKGLAKGLLAVYSAQKLLSYAKASVKAFAEDDKAAKSLGVTLKNLGLAYGANVGTVNGFISRLEMQTGVLDDELRPAMDRLLRATGDVAKSQELLNLALDIAAGTGKSVTQVSQSLQKAYLGQTQALGRLGVGLSRAELTSSSFEEIQQRLTTLFAGQAVSAADSYAGSLAKLTIAGNNAKETIGEGLIDALKAASGSQTVDPVVKGINSIANAIANLARETGDFIAITRENFDLKNLSFFYKDPKAFKGLGNISMSVSSQVDNRTVKNQKTITKLTAEQAKNQAKILKDKRLQAALDKANLALNKSSDVFDMDKIQVAAALKNQTEQLGKATDATQLLQIANDTARLRVKESIAALEDAIAAKDEAAIIKATAKLNEDLKILGVLSGQKNQMSAIESILKGLTPKDLIDQKNLDEALRKIREMLALLAQVKMPILGGGTGGGNGGGGNGGGGTGGGGTGGGGTGTGTGTGGAGTGGAGTGTGGAGTGTGGAGTGTGTGGAGAGTILGGDKPIIPKETTDQINKAVAELGGTVSVIGENGKEFLKLIDGAATVFQIVEDSGAFNALVNSFAKGTIGSFDSGSFRAAEGGSIFSSGAVGSRDRDFVINVNTGVGDPNAIAEAISNVLREAQDRGTLTAV
jgi:hypothetical protein